MFIHLTCILKVDELHKSPSWVLQAGILQKDVSRVKIQVQMHGEGGIPASERAVQGTEGDQDPDGDAAYHRYWNLSRPAILPSEKTLHLREKKAAGFILHDPIVHIFAILLFMPDPKDGDRDLALGISGNLPGYLHFPLQRGKRKRQGHPLSFSASFHNLDGIVRRIPLPAVLSNAESPEELRILRIRYLFL